jgi:hypothetical protein
VLKVVHLKDQKDLRVVHQ